MFELIKKLYEISGKEAPKINRMLFFEVLKSIFEGVMLGEIMLLLLKVFQNVFEDRGIVIQDVFALFGISLLGVIGKILCGFLADRNKYTAMYNMGAENRLYVGNRLKQVNMGFFSSHRLGNISAGLTTVIGELETIGVNIIGMFFVGVIQTVIMALFMIPFDFLTGIIVLATLLLGILSNAVFQRKADELTKKLQVLKINLNAVTLEYIKGISVIKSFGKGEEMISELENHISESRKGFVNVEKTVAPATLISFLIFKLGSCAIILFAVMRFCSNEMTPYKAVMLIVSSFIVFAGFEMAGSMQNIRGIAVQNLDAITKLRELPVISEGNILEMDAATINLNQVGFSYEKQPLFDGIRLSIPERKTTAIIGGSGSGKTTLCNLIARFWDVDKGEILIDGKNIKDFKYDSLLSNFTFVFQDVYLFDDTVKNNIKFGKSNASDEEIIEVAKQAQCHDFIMKLPQGYDTVLQEGGSNLSGGERQRISIARAMLKPSKIVILDEATSSVDPENEEQLVMALQSLLKDKTVLVIAHKLKTIQGADQIVVMDKGGIESVGTHSELLKRSEIYKRFISQRGEAIRWRI